VAESKILTGARQALAYARGELTEGFVAHFLEEFDCQGDAAQARHVAVDVRRKLRLRARRGAELGAGPAAAGGRGARSAQGHRA
jgi:hypothetical protein